jgi:hypothetical protein
MATPARRLFKVALFTGLFLLSARFIGSMPMPECEWFGWFYIAQGLGLREPSDVYIPVNLAVSLIFAVWAYRAVVKLWQCYRAGPAHVEWSMRKTALLHSVSKLALVIGLFVLAVRLIGSYGPMSQCDVSGWRSLSQILVLHDSDDVYIPVHVAVALIVAVSAYRVMVKLWLRYRANKVTWRDTT